MRKMTQVLVLSVFAVSVIAQTRKAPPPPPQLMSDTSTLPTTAFIADSNSKGARLLKDYAPGAKEIVVAYVTLKTIDYAPDKHLPSKTFDKMTIVTPLGPVGVISFDGCDWKISIIGTQLQLDPSGCSYAGSGVYAHFVATVIYK